LLALAAARQLSTPHPFVPRPGPQELEREEGVARWRRLAASQALRNRQLAEAAAAAAATPGGGRGGDQEEAEAAAEAEELRQEAEAEARQAAELEARWRLTREEKVVEGLVAADAAAEGSGGEAGREGAGADAAGATAGAVPAADGTEEQEEDEGIV
jgi:hypothetical protein